LKFEFAVSNFALYLIFSLLKPHLSMGIYGLHIQWRQ